MKQSSSSLPCSQIKWRKQEKRKRDAHAFSPECYATFRKHHFEEISSCGQLKYNRPCKVRYFAVDLTSYEAET